LNDLAITDLQAADGTDIRRLLDDDNAEYRQYFAAFDGDVDQIASILGQARRDRYWAIRAGGHLVGFLMLRGLDDGFAIPAFGVYVSEAYAGKGIGKLALQFALTWCRLNAFDEIMLSVHPSNTSAIHIYEEFGFRFSGVSSARGHRIYRKALP